MQNQNMFSQQNYLLRTIIQVIKIATEVLKIKIYSRWFGTVQSYRTHYYKRKIYAQVFI